MITSDCIHSPINGITLFFLTADKLLIYKNIYIHTCIYINIVNHLFFDFFILATFLLSLSCLQIYSLTTLPPSNSWLLFFHQNYCMYTCICMRTYIPKYNLLSLYNVTCMYLFRADCLPLNDQSVRSPLWRTAPLPPSYALCPVEDRPSSSLLSSVACS